MIVTNAKKQPLINFPFVFYLDSSVNLLKRF